ncbi:uncharacterized protein PRCAT00001929001 [Priceomyces carsonii]|uniref:uncharacterized protein n=1 Tax=Priceomyces carsonii TaxID=28549 RepID=UPI002EDA7DB4|nr:unnamed protein product [Priceomyces carsonii]
MLRAIIPFKVLRPRIFLASKRGPLIALKVLRPLHSSLFLLAKSKKSKKVNKRKDGQTDDETVTTDVQPTIDFDASKSKFENVLSRFSKISNEAKMGRTNPRIFDNLKVATHSGETPFHDIAQTSVKGRNFMITVYDPANVNSIINSVLASDLNMNPQVDPSNKQTLKVPLPPLTTESKQESVKSLKLVFEKFKNGSGKAGDSLASIRGDVRAKFQKQAKKNKSSDAELKVLNDFDLMHKQYVEKLSNVFKAAELAILK